MPFLSMSILKKITDQEGRRMSRALFSEQSTSVCDKHSRTLANLPLPTFSGDSIDWPTYYDLFCGQVHNNNAY